MDMRGPPRIGVIAPRIGAGLHRDEFVTALGIGRGQAGAGEIRIERRGMLVALMDIAAAAVGLPDFDQRVGHAPAVFVEHAAVHDDALAERLAGMLLRQVLIARPDAVMAVDRAGKLGKRVRRHNERPLGRARDRTLVVGRQRRRKCAHALPRKHKRHRTISFHATRSSASDAPGPTPPQSGVRPSRPPDFSSWWVTVNASRAPDMPSGCPSAIAPPLGLTCPASSGNPSCRSTASDWAAKASLSSITAKSPILSFWRSISLRVAGTGPMPMIRGGTPAEAAPSTRARGLSPWRLTAASDAMIIAAAPSLTPEALPAVTVPGLRNGVLSFARPSSVVSGRGCSSLSTMIGPPLPPGAATATISSAK